MTVVFIWEGRRRTVLSDFDFEYYIFEKKILSSVKENGIIQCTQFELIFILYIVIISLLVRIRTNSIKLWFYSMITVIMTR